MEINRILVVMDPTVEAQPVLQRAKLFAQQLEASVELFVSDFSTALEASYLLNKEGLAKAKEVYLKSKKTWLEGFAIPLRNAGIVTSTHVEWRKPLHQSIADRVVEGRADLLMKATHHHSLVNRALLTNTDWHLIRELAIPILFTREHSVETHLNIAAAVDPVREEPQGQRLDHLIVQGSHQLACALPAELHLVHAYEAMPAGVIAEFDTVITDYEVYTRGVKERHQQALNQLVETQLESSTRVHFKEGPTEEVIPQVVDAEGIDIVVMGAVSRSGLDRVFIGSTAERLLDRLFCDVLILK